MTETNTNLAIWNAVEQTDPAYTKQFSKGGGFKGTATNATYLAKKATNQFGPIGIGWGWNVIDETYQPGQDKAHQRGQDELRLNVQAFAPPSRGKLRHGHQRLLVKR